MSTTGSIGSDIREAAPEPSVLGQRAVYGDPPRLEVNSTIKLLEARHHSSPWNLGNAVPLIPLINIARNLPYGAALSSRISLRTFSHSTAFELVSSDERVRFVERKRRLAESYPILCSRLGPTNSPENYRQLNTFVQCIHDALSDGGNLSRAEISNNTKAMVSEFTSPSMSTFSLRSFRGIIGAYTLVIDVEAALVPMVLPVIHPDNLAYQCMHVLLTSSYDLSKVILLVDETLIDRSRCNPGLHTFYNGRIEDEIRRTSMEVFFVPKAVIKRCFPHNVEVPANTIDERMEINRKLHSSFISYASAGCPAYLDVSQFPVPQIDDPIESLEATRSSPVEQVDPQMLDEAEELPS